jgi:hypothetical protein
MAIGFVVAQKPTRLYQAQMWKTTPGVIWQPAYGGGTYTPLPYSPIRTMHGMQGTAEKSDARL